MKLLRKLRLTGASNCVETGMKICSRTVKLAGISLLCLILTEGGKASTVVNFSARANVGTGNNVEIYGVIFQGPGLKDIGFRGLGPSLGVPGLLANPYLELYDANGTLVAQNDDWQDTQAGQIIAAGIAPSNPLESALIATLSPGTYTCILHGKNNGTGIGSIETYDLSANVGQFVNSSARANVKTNYGAIIGGFIIQGNGSRTLLLRGLGRSLGLSGYLVDPQLLLFNSSGSLIYQNDNWKDTQETMIAKSGLAPQYDKESAILITLGPGTYTVNMSGTNLTTGLGSLEIYLQ